MWESSYMCYATHQYNTKQDTSNINSVSFEIEQPKPLICKANTNTLIAAFLDKKCANRGIYPLRIIRNYHILI